MQTNTNTAALNKPVLRQGAKGEAVRELQTLLNKYICDRITVDGNFGPRTTAAVREFQNRMFLAIDGIVGNKTWRSLFTGAPVDMPNLQQGTKGQLVIRIQERLAIGNYYNSAIDGDFGPRTTAAVVALQQNTGLPVDGKVGARTWFELSKIFICAN